MITDADIKKLSKVFMTKRDLKDALIPYSTKKDLKVALAPYSTKKELKVAFTPYSTKKDLEVMLAPYSTKKELEATTVELIKYIGEVKIELKNDILSFKDQVLFEINKLRDDVTVTTGYRDMIQDHEVRIETLEAKI